VIVIQLTLLVADHAQPADVVSAIVLLDAVTGRLAAVGSGA
jgi:hypothetical protein